VEGEEKGVEEEEKDVAVDEAVTRTWMRLYLYRQHSLCEETKLPTKDS